MMNRMKKVILTTLLTAIASSSMIAEAQGQQRRPGARWYGEPEYSQQFVRAVDKVQSDAERLQKNVDRLLDDSRRDGTQAEDRINDQFKKLRDAANRLEERVDDNDPPEGEMRELNESWKEVENMLRRNPMVARNVQRDLDAMRTSMTQLREFVNSRVQRRMR